MGKRQKKYLKILAVVLVIVAVLRFVPVYSKQGYVIHNRLSIVCTGVNGTYPGDVILNDDYRLAFGGLAGFKDDKKVLTDKNLEDTCATKMRLRLFIL